MHLKNFESTNKKRKVEMVEVRSAVDQCKSVHVGQPMVRRKYFKRNCNNLTNLKHNKKDFSNEKKKKIINVS